MKESRADNKRVITCARTGSVHIPSMAKYLPKSPAEIKRSGIETLEASASIGLGF